MSDEKTLMRMANQIAANFRSAPEEEAIASVATHIRQFWTPRMRQEISALATRGAAGLDPVVTKALASLAAKSG
jgi:formate dehydrogenase subunit delta